MISIHRISSQTEFRPEGLSRGGLDPAMAAALDMALAAAPAPTTAAPAHAAPLEAEQSEMAFTPRFRRPLARSE